MVKGSWLASAASFVRTPTVVLPSATSPEAERNPPMPRLAEPRFTQLVRALEQHADHHREKSRAPKDVMLGDCGALHSWTLQDVCDLVDDVRDNANNGELVARYRAQLAALTSWDFVRGVEALFREAMRQADAQDRAQAGVL
jgi:hypothetical protein